MTKHCTACLVEKPMDSFSIDRQRNNGRRARCRECMSAYRKERRKDPAVRAYERDAYRRCVYGISTDDFNELRAKQGNRCAICGEHEDNLLKGLYIDHCHSTGKVRSLLCHHCNVALGHLKDDIKIIRKMAEYIKEHT